MRTNEEMFAELDAFIESVGSDPSEMIAIVTINLKIGEVEGLMNVCLPYLTLEDVIDKLNTKYWYSNLQNQDTTDYTESIETLIRRAQIPIKAVLGNSMISVNDFAMLQPGDIIRLNRKVEDELDICTAQKPLSNFNNVTFEELSTYENFGITPALI